jgi:hypothetical protein
MKSRTSSAFAIAAIAGFTIIAQADAQYTTVNASPGSELGHAAILNNIYGGSWSASGVNVTSGASTATRIMDAGAPFGVGLSSISPAISQDDVWSSGGESVTVIARAKYAGDSHIFGWFDDTQAEPVFQPIFATGVFDAPVAVELSSSFRWALQNTSTGRTFTSLPSSNLGAGTRSGESFDQLVSYHVTGPDGLSQIALFWEDRIAGESADYDYNDAVITVTTVPAPGTGLLAGLGLLGLAGRRRR